MVCFSCENNVRKLISKYAHQHNGKFLIVYFPRNRYCETPISEAGSYFEVEPWFDFIIKGGDWLWMSNTSIYVAIFIFVIVFQPGFC